MHPTNVRHYALHGHPLNGMNVTQTFRRERSHPHIDPLPLMEILEPSAPSSNGRRGVIVLPTFPPIGLEYDPFAPSPSQEVPSIALPSAHVPQDVINGVHEDDRVKSSMASRGLGRNLSRSAVARTALLSMPARSAPLTSIQGPHRSPSLERLREHGLTVRSPLLQQSPLSYLLRSLALPSLPHPPAPSCSFSEWQQRRLHWLSLVQEPASEGSLHRQDWHFQDIRE